MSTTTQTSNRGRGRPRIADPIRVRYEPDFMEFAREYADRNTAGNLNEALRQIGNLGREVAEQRDSSTHAA